MKYLKEYTPQLRSKPVNTLNSVSVTSGKPVILGDFLKKGDFYYRNAIFSTFTP